MLETEKIRKCNDFLFKKQEVYETLNLNLYIKDNVSGSGIIFLKGNIYDFYYNNLRTFKIRYVHLRFHKQSSSQKISYDE
jgi:hypothetical protein